MVDSTPELNEWSRLYEAAIGAKKMSPWEWMPEVDVFGMQNPETGEIGFVNIIGGPVWQARFTGDK